MNAATDRSGIVRLMSKRACFAPYQKFTFSTTSLSGAVTGMGGSAGAVADRVDRRLENTRFTGMGGAETPGRDAVLLPAPTLYRASVKDARRRREDLRMGRPVRLSGRRGPISSPRPNSVPTG